MLEVFEILKQNIRQTNWLSTVALKAQKQVSHGPVVAFSSRRSHFLSSPL